MQTLDGGDPFPFFLQSALGSIYGLHLPPAPDLEVRGAILWLQPFAEEANCARRHMMAAARECQAEGYASLLVDLHGTGESEGDLIETRWSTWRQNILDAAAWLRRAHAVPLWLCGVRAGALFAANVAADLAPAGLLCWQPITTGKALLDGFLRMKLASEWSQAGSAPAGEILKAVRSRLDAGESIEVAGYALSSQLAADLNGLSFVWPAAACKFVALQEFRSSKDDTQRPDHTPAMLRLHEELRSRGISVATAACSAPAFWQLHETALTRGIGQSACGLMRTLRND